MFELLRERWMDEASCADMPCDMFFPSDGAGVVRAQRVCAKCPVIMSCLEYALRHRVDHGVWGGCSERKRRRILKARATGSPVMISKSVVVASEQQTEVDSLEERKQAQSVA